MISTETVQQMTKRIIENFAPQKVIAFGSWARGETNADSDIDFLIVMPYSGSKRELQVSIRRYLKDFDVPKDVIVASPEELAEKRFLNGYIYQSAILEGKVLYEQ
jgi:predicted nucleotidyltransferase